MTMAVTRARSAGQVLITRETFVDPDELEYLGATKASHLYVPSEDGSEGERIEVPSVVRKTGILPDGFSVDLIVDPITVVGALRKQGLIYESQLPPGMVESMQQVLLSPDNMCIVPTSICQAKLALFLSQAEDDTEDDTEEGEGEEEVDHEEAGGSNDNGKGKGS